MANRFFNPNEQFVDSTGKPYAGGQLFFFASGTSTPLNTYTNQALTIPNTNPVVLDSAGRAGSVFLQNLAYKVQLFDVNSNLIWTEDPVYASDISTIAQVASTNGNPNGQLAGTSGSVSTSASMAWDFANRVLYVCVQSGNAATAVWSAINPPVNQQSIPAPQGRLTPVSGTPVINADAVGTSIIYYTPYVGNLIPVLSGSQFALQSFISDLVLTLTAGSFGANTAFDVFAFMQSNTLTLGGVAWSNSSAGSSARNIGLVRLGGLLVNAAQCSMINGATAYTVGANNGTYLGSFYTIGAGQITCNVGIGQSRVWGLWNAYNRVPITLGVSDPTANWAYGTATVRASNNNSGNAFTSFCGLPEEYIYSVFNQQFESTQNTTDSFNQIFIGLNSTVTPSGFSYGSQDNFTANGTTGLGTLIRMIGAQFGLVPTLGVNTFNCLEKGNQGAGNTTTFFGSSNMLMTGQYRG